MDKGDIWLPQKIAPISGKIHGAEADAFNHRAPINTWLVTWSPGHLAIPYSLQPIDHSGH